MRSWPFLDLSRRDFFSYFGATAGTWLAVHVAARHSTWATPPQDVTPSQASAGGPANPDWRTVIAAPDEPGEPLIVSGVVYAADGHTPVSGARLYVYHTDAKGLYSLPGDNARLPRLRGWMKTNSNGAYEFRTIKPAPYPVHRIPAHIHATISTPGYTERWLPEFWFDGDPFLAKKDIVANIGKARFSQILKLNRSAEGVLRATHDILLA